MNTSKKSSEDHWIEEFSKFALDFKNESDRAAVILGAAKLDIILFQILQNYLKPAPSGKDELLEGDSPLATFSSRINMCHRLGLITDEFARALHLIRRIRNSFAHEMSSVSLDSGAHKDRIRELVAPFLIKDSISWLIEDYLGGKHTPGNQFRAVVAFLSIRLDGLFEKLGPIKPPIVWVMCPDISADKKEMKKPSPKLEPKPAGQSALPDKTPKSDSTN